MINLKGEKGSFLGNIVTFLSKIHKKLLQIRYSYKIRTFNTGVTKGRVLMKATFECVTAISFLFYFTQIINQSLIVCLIYLGVIIAVGYTGC